MRLHTIFGERNILKGVNLTEIQKGYNLVDFEINRLICSNFQAKLSPKQHLGLEFPDYIQQKKLVIMLNTAQVGGHF